MKIAIAGAGSVGIAIAEDLVKNGHEVMVFEQEPEVAARLNSTTELRVIAGDACELATLRANHLEEVDVMVAATGDDEDNLVISLLAKQEFAVPRVIARVNNTKNDWLFDETWGVDVAVSTPQLLTSLVEEAFAVGSLVKLMTFDDGNANLFEVTLADTSPADGKMIEDLDLGREVVVVAVVRNGHVVTPAPNLQLNRGDEVVILAPATRTEAITLSLIGR
jgi:trk system potassium uptake protein TrkA